MDISATTLSLSSSLSSIPRTSPSSSPSSLSISSCNSAFFNNGGNLLKKKKSNCLVLSRPREAQRGFNCRCLFGLGVPELVVIAGVVAVVFGPKKLPEVGRSIGKTIKSFQQAAKEFETELKKEPEASIGDSSENSTPVSEEKKQESKVPSTEES